MKQAPRNGLKRKVRVCYPAGTGTLVLRTDLDWERDIDPVAVSSDGNMATFEIKAQRPFVYFKPCLIESGRMHWAVGTNNLLIMAGEDNRVVYPFFFSDPRGRFSPLVEVESAILNRRHRLRVYLPPGYEENTLARYPFAYMQDGQNLFFPHEAFQHKDWQVARTRGAMSANGMGRRPRHHCANRIASSPRDGFRFYSWRRRWATRSSSFFPHSRDGKRWLRNPLPRKSCAQSARIIIHILRQPRAIRGDRANSVIKASPANLKLSIDRFAACSLPAITKHR